MITKIKLPTKILAVLLTMLMVMSVVPMQSFAETKHSFPNDNSNKTQEKIIPTIEREIISERTLYSKVYATDDGGYYTIISATPIHSTDKDGNYIDIVETSLTKLSESEIERFVESEAKMISDRHEPSRSGTTLNDLYNNPQCLIKCFQYGEPINNGLFVQGEDYDESKVFVLPDIVQSSTMITSGKLIVSANGYSATSNNYVVVKEVSDPWNNSSTTEPDYDEVYFDGNYILRNSIVSTDCSFDITNQLNSWILGIKANNGVVLTTDNERCCVTIQNIYVSYYYHEIGELDDNFTYEEVDMGIAGTMCVNHFTCAPTVVVNDMGIDGELAPVSIKHVFNGFNDSTTNYYGHGFRINYESKLKYLGLGSYKWDTVDGEIIYFSYNNDTSDSVVFVGCNSSSSYNLIVPKDTNTGNAEYTNYNDIEIIKQNNNATDLTCQTYTFETHSDTGYLVSLSDGSENQNTITISYDIYDPQEEITLKSNQIQEIIDGAGRKYVFDYTLTNGSSCLHSITAYDGENNIVSVGNGLNASYYCTEYSYTTINNMPFLTSINFVGNKSAVFTYSNNRIETISNGIKELSLIYAGNDTNKLLSYETVIIDGLQHVPYESTSINSSWVYKRIFTNQDNETCVINYDHYYNTVFLKDYDGTVICGMFDNGDINYLSDDSYGENLLSNSEFENISNNRPTGWTKKSGVIKVSNTNSASGYSLGVKGNSQNTARVYQVITPNTGTSFLSGETFAFGGKSQADNALPFAASNQNLPDFGEHVYGIKIYDAYVDNNNVLQPNDCIATVFFDETLHTWQQKMSTFTLMNSTPALFFTICFDYNFDGVFAYFDDMQLFNYTSENLMSEENVTYLKNDNDSVTSKKILSKVNNNPKYMEVSYTYDNTNSLNYLSSLTGYDGITTYYTYNPINGQLESEAVGYANNKKYMEYTADGLLSTVRQSVTNILTGNTVNMVTSYSYINDNISSVTHNGFTYNLTYDAYGNITSISVNNSNTPSKIISYSNPREQLVNSITYSNGCVIEYQYDSVETDKITQICYKDSQNNIIKSFEYTYDTNGNIASITDSKTNIILSYSDGAFSFILDNGEDDVVLYSSSINNEGNIVENYNTDNAVSMETTSQSVLEDALSGNVITTSEQTVSTDTSNYDCVYSFEKSNTVDEFGRTINNTIIGDYALEATNVNSTDFNNRIKQTENYSYISIGNKETLLPETYSVSSSVAQKDINGDYVLNNNEYSYSDIVNVTFSYTYDAAGNITSVIARDNLTNEEELYAYYKYDEANQITFEYSVLKDVCIKYAYDAGGNITCKRVYTDGADAFDVVTEDTIANALYKDYTYTYDSAYKDRLYSFSEVDNNNLNPIINSITFSYDAYNNPTNWDLCENPGTFEWTGNLLTAFETNGEGYRYEYEYDSNGMRIRKTIKEKTIINDNPITYGYEDQYTIDYVWDNNTLKGIIMSTDNGYSASIPIIYDDNGVAQGYIGLSGTPYYYTRDGLGNIVKIQSAVDDSISVKIDYDAWGNPTFPTVPSGWENLGLALATSIICLLNPCSYKGYLYDCETGLYYCGSRYYSPILSRFLSVDNESIIDLTDDELLGANRFAYCDNNPVSNSDPFGMLGKCWYNKVSNVALALDIVILIITTGKALVGIKALRAFLKANQRKIVKNVTKELIKMFGSYGSTMVTFAFEAVFTIFGTSIGQIIAKALDYVDPWWNRGYVRNNGYIFN